MFVRQVELAAKRVEFTREVLPRVQKIALWWDFLSRDQIDPSAAAARTLGMEMRLIEIDATRDYDAAYRQSESLGVEAVVLPS